MTLDLLIPPPLIGLITGGAMAAVAWALPGLDFGFPGQLVVAGAIAAAGLALDVLSALRFLRARTTVNPMRPENTSDLVVSGLYRFTRNPMYLGLMLVLTGWAVWLGNAAALLLLPAFVAYITRFQIKPEEARLSAKFGDAYEVYCQRVRRWI